MKEGWEYKKLGDTLQKVKYTKKIQSSDYLQKGLVPIVSQEEETISGYWNIFDDAFIVDSPVVIFGDHNRVLKYINFNFVLGADGVKILKPIKNLNARFLFHFLKWYNVPSLGYSRHYKLLKEIILPIPPLSEQQHIVEELDLLSSIIEKKKAQLKELDNLAQSIFYEMFGDPSNWELMRLKEITTKMGSGATPRGGNQSYKEEGISLIRSLNIHNGYFKYEDLAHIDEQQASQLNNVIIEENDVLLNITGASVARCCIVPSDVLPARVNQHVSILRVNKTIINSIYLCNYLISRNSQTELLTMSKSNAATREALPKSTLEKYLVPIPPLDLQELFASKIQSIEHQKALIKQSITEVETLFNSRMDYYFN